MPDEDLRRLQELLRVASRIEPAALAQFLMRAEPRRPDLRAEVASLLAHDTGRGELVAAPAEEPRFVGPYRLLDRLGEAPPARLYRAERAGETPRDFLVAVAGPGPAAERVADALRQQAARQERLRDPAIARLLDAGATEDGHLYLAFEPLSGVPLVEIGDALRLTVSERVALVEAVARAVEQAHAAGLAPLGLLPWSVLGTWRSGALDVGLIAVDPWPLLALLEPDRRAESELLAGLETSAPESLRGESRGVATDVYALGALLFEAVTGTPPLGLRRLAGKRSLREELHRAATLTPPAASLRVESLGQRGEPLAALRSTSAAALVRELRGGLDEVLLRALSPDPQRRQVSAGALALELARWRAGLGSGLMNSARDLGRRLGFGTRSAITLEPPPTDPAGEPGPQP